MSILSCEGMVDIMKKQAIIYFLLLIIGANIQILYTNQKVEATEPMVIPDEAIRLRILANSDSKKDQHVKRLIRDEVNAQITTWVQELTSVEDARDVIKSNLPTLEAIAKKVMKEQGMDQIIHVDFGKVSFPTKLYGQLLYPAGEYEAVLITLGEGEGANWWCVLFPPMCFLDFSNGEAIESPMPEEEQPVEKKEMIKAVAEEVEKVDANHTDHSNLVASTSNLAQEVAVKEAKKEKQQEKSSKKVQEKEEEVEVKFFIVELASSLFK